MRHLARHARSIGWQRGTRVELPSVRVGFIGLAPGAIGSGPSGGSAGVGSARYVKWLGGVEAYSGLPEGADGDPFKSTALDTWGELSGVPGTGAARAEAMTRFLRLKPRGKLPGLSGVQAARDEALAEDTERTKKADDTMAAFSFLVGKVAGEGYAKLSRDAWNSFKGAGRWFNGESADSDEWVANVGENTALCVERRVIPPFTALRMGGSGALTAKDTAYQIQYYRQQFENLSFDDRVIADDLYAAFLASSKTALTTQVFSLYPATWGSTIRNDHLVACVLACYAPLLGIESFDAQWEALLAELWEKCPIGGDLATSMVSVARMCREKVAAHVTSPGYTTTLAKRDAVERTVGKAITKIAEVTKTSPEAVRSATPYALGAAGAVVVVAAGAPFYWAAVPFGIAWVYRRVRAAQAAGPGTGAKP